LKEIERINGKVFDLAGFGWDYSGTIYDFNGGKLDYLKKNGLFLRLSPKIESSQTPDYSKTLGDRNFQSSNPSMQKLNPTVYQIIYDFK